jgi:hypothetical protein
MLLCGKGASRIQDSAARSRHCQTRLARLPKHKGRADSAVRRPRRRGLPTAPTGRAPIRRNSTAVVERRLTTWTSDPFERPIDPGRRLATRDSPFFAELERCPAREGIRGAGTAESSEATCSETKKRRVSTGVRTVSAAQGRKTVTATTSATFEQRPSPETACDSTTRHATFSASDRPGGLSRNQPQFGRTRHRHLLPGVDS